jgi:fatty acid CoA ligase FadD36
VRDGWQLSVAVWQRSGMDGGLLPALDGAFGDGPDAVRVAGEATSYAALAVSAAALAREIAGARAAAVVADGSLATVVAVAAGLTAGVPVVPVPPDAGTVERAHILTDSGAQLLLTPAGPVAMDAGSATARPPDGTALVLYTSGTTGSPKGVPVTRAAIAADLDALAEAWDWTAADHLVHGLPLYHVHGLVLGVLGALRTGSRLTHTGRPRAEAYAAAGGTLFFGVPTVWGRVAAAPAAARALRPARLLVSGSAPLPTAVFADLAALTGHRPVERYGMTETLITVSARADGPRRPGTVGTPVRGAVTRVVDGELQVRGPMVFAGYLNREHQPFTGESFTADGWFRTGDVAEIEPDGTHRVVGRASADLIKTGGYRVGAGEVEEALLAHPAVREAAVVGAPDADLGQRIVAYVVADEVSDGDLVAFVAGRVSAHKRPREVRFVDGLPRNALGKVQKHRL